MIYFIFDFSYMINLIQLMNVQEIGSSKFDDQI